jgi:hypothetical protein
MTGMVGAAAALGAAGCSRAPAPEGAEAPAAKARPQQSGRTLLDPSEPEAMAVAYVHDARTVDPAKFPAFESGQTCQTCALLESGTGRMRGCSLFPGRLVMPTGWCTAWVPRGGRR